MVYLWSCAACKNCPYTIFVEGNIGVGKTTFTHHLIYSFTSVKVVPEPTHYWTDERGRNYLDLFYKNPEQYGYRVQRKILDTYGIIKSMCSLHHAGASYGCTTAICGVGQRLSAR